MTAAPQLLGAAGDASVGEGYPAPGYSPLGGLVVQPDGRISYRFQGGIELLAAGDPHDLGQFSTVSWLEHETARVAAIAEAFSDGLARNLTVRAGQLDPADDPAMGMAYVQLAGNATGAASIVAGTDGLGQLTLVDQLLRSSFVQLRTPSRVRLLFGLVGPTGTKIAGSDGWSASGAGGVVTITFTDAFAELPIPLAIPHYAGGEDVSVRASAIGTGAVTLNTRWSSGTLIASNIAFAVLGLI